MLHTSPKASSESRSLTGSLLEDLNGGAGVMDINVGQAIADKQINYNSDLGAVPSHSTTLANLSRWLEKPEDSFSHRKLFETPKNYDLPLKWHYQTPGQCDIPVIWCSTAIRQLGSWKTEILLKVCPLWARHLQHFATHLEHLVWGFDER